MEHEINSIPLGFLQHQDNVAPLLRILTPNFLKLNAANNRSPKDLFTMPNSGPDLMTRVEEAYKLFFRVWNTDYVPLKSRRQKWHSESDNLVPGDIVYFKLKDSVLSAKWVIGKIEDVVMSKDGKVRRLIIGYKFDTEQGDRLFRTVERPVRECVKLMNIEDTSLFEDIAEVRLASEKILSSNVIWYHANDTSKLQFVPTYACNISSSLGLRRVHATDIGYVVPGDASGVVESSADVFGAEFEIGAGSDGNEMFFMINDNDTHDNYFDNEYNDIYLL